MKGAGFMWKSQIVLCRRKTALYYTVVISGIIIKLDGMNHEILNKYLAQNKSISIPGLGALVVEDVPAISDFINRQIHPMQQKLRFDKYFDSPDRDFFNYLAQQQRVPDFEAIRWYNEFAYELRNSIRTDGSAKWQGLGEFKKDESGDIGFEPQHPGYELYATITAERVIRTAVNHSILVGDKEKTSNEMTEYFVEEKEGTPLPKTKWWKFALAAALLALAVLVFHLSKNGFRWGSSGNRQSVSVAGFKVKDACAALYFDELNKLIC